LQDIFERAAADAEAEVLPADPLREDWLVHKVRFYVFALQCMNTLHIVLDNAVLQWA